ncbi:hypothetical protein ALC53_00274 [Atta colombica]|uniref:Uncharacterized protein n=1 Tax=Atta colombica TaxID=520822 RepID=A0A195BXM0_9HYME|nr:hypothetical protein ALC53_00274 [Atta colombica]
MEKKTTVERNAEKQESVEEREKEGKTKTVREGGSGGILKLTCPEPYFLSEGLYATPEELENTREITLHVITIGAFIEDSTKFINPVDSYNLHINDYIAVTVIYRDLTLFKLYTRKIVRIIIFSINSTLYLLLIYLHELIVKNILNAPINNFELIDQIEFYQ